MDNKAPVKRPPPPPLTQSLGKLMAKSGVKSGMFPRTRYTQSQADINGRV
jgi:hypothetical protein